MGNFEEPKEPQKATKESGEREGIYSDTMDRRHIEAERRAVEEEADRVADSLMTPGSNLNKDDVMKAMTVLNGGADKATQLIQKEKLHTLAIMISDGYPSLSDEGKDRLAHVLTSQGIDAAIGILYENMDALHRIEQLSPTGGVESKVVESMQKMYSVSVTNNINPQDHVMRIEVIVSDPFTHQVYFELAIPSVYP